MTDQQENRLSAAKSVQLSFQKSIIVRSKAHDKTLTELDGAITSIDTLSQKQGVDTKGVPKDKEALEKQCVTAAMKMVGPAKSYAAETGNNTLKSALNFSEAKLKKLRDTQLKNALEHIANTITPELPNLADYDVTDKDVKNLKDLTAKYDPMIGAPRVATADKSGATKEMKAAFTKLGDIMKRIDGVMLGKKSSDPEYYTAYKTARKNVGNNGKVVVKKV